MRRTALALMSLARAIRSAVQWVVSVGGSANVSATTRSATSGPNRGIREGRVLSRKRPSTPERLTHNAGIGDGRRRGVHIEPAFACVGGQCRFQIFGGHRRIEGCWL